MNGDDCERIIHCVRYGEHLFVCHNVEIAQTEVASSLSEAGPFPPGTSAKNRRSVPPGTSAKNRLYVDWLGRSKSGTHFPIEAFIPCGFM
jgi:hypothetical protein